MSKIEKLIVKFMQQPNGIKFNEVEKVLQYYGYEMKKTTRNIS